MNLMTSVADTSTFIPEGIGYPVVCRLVRGHRRNVGSVKDFLGCGGGITKSLRVLLADSCRCLSFHFRPSDTKCRESRACCLRCIAWRQLHSGTGSSLYCNCANQSNLRSASTGYNVSDVPVDRGFVDGHLS